VTQGRSGRVRKISPLRGFDPRTVQPVASLYIDWAIPAHNNDDDDVEDDDDGDDDNDDDNDNNGTSMDGFACEVYGCASTEGGRC